MKKFQLFIISCMFSIGSVCTADDDYEHSEGLRAETLQQALQNYDLYNKKLSEKLAHELTPEAMHEIHMLSYTLENALEKIEEVIEQHQEDLEEIHEASEHMNAEKVTKFGNKYLETSSTLRN